MNASQIFTAAHLEAKKTYAGAKWVNATLTYAALFRKVLRRIYAEVRERKAVLALATPELVLAATTKQLDQAWWNALTPGAALYHVTSTWATALNGVGSEWGAAAVATAMVADQAYSRFVSYYNAAMGAELAAGATYGTSFYGYTA